MTHRDDIIKGGSFGTPTRLGVGGVDDLLMPTLDPAPFWGAVCDGTDVYFVFTPPAETAEAVKATLDNADIGYALSSSAATIALYAPWNAGTTYAVGDLVQFHAPFMPTWVYGCIKAHSGHTPPNATYWVLSQLDAITLDVFPMPGQALRLFNVGALKWVSAADSGYLLNPMTHEGDMIVGDGPTGVYPAGYPKRLPYVPDADGVKFLISRFGRPEWAQLLLSWFGAVAVSRVPTQYATPGPFSHVVSAGVTRVEVDIWGGGGAAANHATPLWCGAGGGHCFAAFSVTPGETLDVVVGAGGVSGGADGETSSVTQSAVVVAQATGGQTGVDSLGATPAAGGIGSGIAAAKVVRKGQDGLSQAEGYLHLTQDSPLTPGEYDFLPGEIHGGDAPLGGVGGCMHSATSVHTSGAGGVVATLPTQPGGGGAAPLFSDMTPQDGADGMVIVWEYR